MNSGLIDWGKPVGKEYSSLDNAESVEREIIDSLAYDYAVKFDSSSYKAISDNVYSYTVCKDGKECTVNMVFPTDRKTLNFAVADLFNQWCK